MKKLRFSVAAVVLSVAVLLCACMSGDYKGNGGDGDPNDENHMKGFEIIETDSGDAFSEINERGFLSASENPTSAFSLTASRTAYTYMRNSVNSGRLPQPDSVRIEEYINYFDYSVPAPQSGEFSAVASVFDCPWNAENKLMRISYATKEIERESASNNLVFLVDTSASMYGEDRLGLFKTAATYVAESLGPDDRLSVVTYASGCNTLLDGVGADGRDEIIDAVQALTARGNTAGENAIRLAYEVAVRNKTEDGNNRIVLFTDGDFNVGASSVTELKNLVESYRNMGIYLSAAGVGYGNYKDNVLESIAEAGNGETYYLDSAAEAKRVFGEELTGTLYTVAEDAKAQVSFTDAVDKYRLIGYDNRTLTGVQFEDENTDAGEIGSGRQITALYEIIPAAGAGADAAYATAQLRYRVPDSGEQKELTAEVFAGEESGDDAFIACVAEYGLLLRNSAYADGISFYALTSRLAAMQFSDSYRSEFRTLVNKAAGIQQKQTNGSNL